MRKALTLIALLLLPGLAPGITIEVVRLFQPLSLHGTDGAGDDEQLEEVLQASVMSRPMAVSGAIPEDLVNAVAEPYKIQSNSPAYEVPEANLIVLCQLEVVAQMKDDRLVVVLDLSKFTIPDEVDLSSRQVLRMAITGVRKTLEHYYGQIEEELEWQIVITGTNDGTASLKDLSAKYKIGG